MVHDMMLRKLDALVNRKVFRMYDMAVAFINSEDEVLNNVARFVPSEHMINFVREEATTNKLEVGYALISHIH